MVRVIASDSVVMHQVEKYNFKSISSEVDGFHTRSQVSFIEALMHKNDLIYSQFIKLQMQHEEEVLKNENLVTHEQKEKFTLFVKRLEESSHGFDTTLEVLKNELLSTALDIAKEVLRVELSLSSSEIATRGATELIKELQSASKLTLKVNPKDYGVLSEAVDSLQNVAVVSDHTVSIGGVIALSDAGNREAEILNKFERIKKTVLSKLSTNEH